MFAVLLCRTFLSVVLRYNSLHTLFSQLRMLQLNAASMRINAAFIKIFVFCGVDSRAAFIRGRRLIE